jgi:hypothetical protein
VVQGGGINGVGRVLRFFRFDGLFWLAPQSPLGSATGSLSRRFKLTSGICQFGGD